MDALERYAPGGPVSHVLDQLANMLCCHCDECMDHFAGTHQARCPEWIEPDDGKGASPVDFGRYSLDFHRVIECIELRCDTCRALVSDESMWDLAEAVTAATKHENEHHPDEKPSSTTGGESSP